MPPAPLGSEHDHRPLLALSNIIVDDIWLADGSHYPATLGGAATYAATGAALWYTPVGIVAGVGNDLDEVSGNKLRDFGLLSEGHLVRGPHTIQSKLIYFPDGTRTETPTHGREYFESLQITPADVPDSLAPAAATYVFRDLEPRFWSALLDDRRKFGSVLWELQDDAAYPEFWSQVRSKLGLIDHFSLNRAEAERLFEGAQTDDILDRLLDTGVETVLLRMGAEGALVATAKTRIMVVPPVSSVVDVTGGGNAFCGGFLGAWMSSSGNLEVAARGATAAATHALQQYGPGDPRRREQAAVWAQQTRLQDWTKP